MLARAPRSIEKALLSNWRKRSVMDDDIRPFSPRSQPMTRLMSSCYSIFLKCSASPSAIYPGRRSGNSIAVIHQRTFSGSSSNDNWDAESGGLQQYHRNKSIIMNPAGQGQHILPGGCFILKKDPKKGLYRKVILEHALGYFWAIKELASTNKKPILSNHAVIPAAEAEKFPFLGDMVSLNGEEAVSIPDFFTRNNRSKDASAKCTLVAISYKDFGAQLLPSWIDPFDRAFRWDSNETDRYEVVRIIINEGRMMKLLSPFITSGTRKSVPESDHSNTLLYYGDAEEFRDILRMHNIYTGYVFLVDGIGRVRWAGSGDGTEEEVQSMIRFAKELTKSELRRYPQNHVPRIGKRVQ